MRILIGSIALVGLTACQTTVPDSGAGVGFKDYNQYQAEKAARDAALAGQAVPPATAISGESSGSSAEALAAEAEAALLRTQANSGTAPVQTASNARVPQTVTGAAGISSENDFNAVGAQRSIESDAALIEANKQQYKVVQPTAIPQRSGSGGPNIVAYALNTSNAPGTQVYSRPGINKQARFQKNCAKYPSPDKAQEEFLSKGGPRSDKLGLDPDGDGFACSWDPRPFRKVRG